MIFQDAYPQFLLYEQSLKRGKPQFYLFPYMNISTFKGDWFHEWQIAEYLKEDDELYDGKIMNEYCKTIERLEIAALAKKAISILE